ncbi:MULTISPECIES: DUF2970 domain-containing protein [Marinobacter]|uniref:DUF2970 domain-containing protein n=1 Tax=Marinobacter segnicrescens TaxID=430453 RepID=A0A1I0D259_9GAMM|nr:MULTISPECIES: DUF2970 domain-containing protein [Marinobacter]UZD67560.1 DUF2970 domain-containing protein [Marinobacter sp. AN1]SET26174.1 Protein of unknown function [Marinobacter segnicrescens]
MSDQVSGQSRNGDHPPRRKGPGVLKVLQSVMAGAFGVQSGKRHEEDFSSHSPWPYIVAGLIFTVGFVGALALIVQWVLASH